MKRSKHSLSRYRLTSFNQGRLHVASCEEILPGDTWREQVSALVRVSPLVAPVMHPVHLMAHTWYVPTRLLWDNWEPFITGSDPNLTVPTITLNKAASPENWALAQQLGVGVEASASNIVVSSLPFRAYNLIWNEFYRDQDLNNKRPFSTGNGPDTNTDYIPLFASWEKDYFTTCRPYPQQGADTSVVNLSLTGQVPIKGIGLEGTGVFPLTNVAARETGGTTPTYPIAAEITQGAANRFRVKGSAAAGGFPEIYGDLSGMAPGSINMDINAWRQAMAMQRMREHRNRFGSRYRDLLSFYGITPSDARLQRPEYVGGGKQTVSFSEVLSTAATDDAVVGDMAGHGIAALRTRPYKRFFEEHGYLITFICARPQSVYVNKVARHFLRRDYEQYWQKELEMMGDQAVTNFEVYGDSATPSGVFGYIPRYDEYRHAESFVTGEFRNILDYWHMGRIFTSQPALNGGFVSCQPTDRIYASADTDELYAMVAFRTSARRLVSKRARN